MYVASYKPYALNFIKPARTSRGEMLTHHVYYITLTDTITGKITWGEAAPLPGLSIDDRPDFEEHLQNFCSLINEGTHPLKLDLALFPSILFALETAVSSHSLPGRFTVFENDFVKGKPIPINGLVWMDNKDSMLKQAASKIDAGFHCIKFKVGALDFDEECRMIEAIRKRFSAFQLEIRLDANGAFKNEDVLQQLKDLSRFEIHSVEQPVKPKQPEMMAEIVSKSPIDIALDEELIGIELMQAKPLLTLIRPAYIILKPTLLGGFNASQHWLKTAESLDIDWWATSALESNIGLNAIAQWTSKMKTALPQGLGTGQLYNNNIPCPLKAEKGFLSYDPLLSWKLPQSLLQ